MPALGRGRAGRRLRHERPWRAAVTRRLGLAGLDHLLERERAGRLDSRSSLKRAARRRGMRAMTVRATAIRRSMRAPDRGPSRSQISAPRCAAATAPDPCPYYRPLSSTADAPRRLRVSSRLTKTGENSAAILPAVTAVVRPLLQIGHEFLSRTATRNSETGIVTLHLMRRLILSQSSFFSPRHTRRRTRRGPRQIQRAGRVRHQGRAAQPVERSAVPLAESDASSIRPTPRPGTTSPSPTNTRGNSRTRKKAYEKALAAGSEEPHDPAELRSLQRNQ